ncbi:SCP2 sterol-binding domain-containing protein [Halocatena halophila]|uniref:SCP2 sterol-binding domain-containing protein n=1 Tax=Halocatena halophila TaxID=2814576 RepID=UPI002ED1AF6F
MATTEHTLATYFPTEPWLERYRTGIERSEQVTETGEGWGVGWNGEMVFEITSLPLESNSLGDLPEPLVDSIEETVFETLEAAELEEIIAAAPPQIQSAIDERTGSLRERAFAELQSTSLVDAPDRLWPELRSVIPEVLLALLEQLETRVVDSDTIYAWLDLRDGTCDEVAVLSEIGERDHGFVLSGPYDVWKRLVAGDAGVINLIMGGELELDGDMQKLLQYSDAAIALTEVAAETDSEFLF